MLKTILLRLLGALPNLIGVVVITFLLTRALPGDPAAFFAGQAATVEAVEQIREKLGLNKTLPEQFILYWERCATAMPLLREVAPGHHVACHFA